MKEKFYRLTKILKANAVWNMILGQRDNGKSYAVKEQCIKDAWNNKLMVYLRRWDIDIKRSKVERYFQDMQNVIKRVTKGKCDCITYFSESLYFSRTNEKGIAERISIAGYTVGLSGQSHDKSINFPDAYNIIFEEFVTDDVYLDNESELLFNIVSTIKRRHTVRVWLIGNTISRLCPYYSEWELTNIPHQKVDTIEVYEKIVGTDIITGENRIVRVAVELCDEITENDIFFGESADTVTSGKWNSKKMPHLPLPYNDYKSLYKVVIKKYNMEYMIEVLKTNIYVLYVHPNTDKKFTGRILQNAYDPHPATTQYLTELTKGDIMIKDLLKNNKICFSDDLTGTEFYTLYKGGEII